MFNKKQDPELLNSVKNVMSENDRLRANEKAMNEKFGVYSRNALTLEQKAEYDRALADLNAGKTQNLTEETLKEESEQLQEKEGPGAKWRRGYEASGHPIGYKHTGEFEGKVGPLGGSYRMEPYYDDFKKVPVDRYRDGYDALDPNLKKKMGLTQRGEPLKNQDRARRNLKRLIKANLERKHNAHYGPRDGAVLPEESEQIQEISTGPLQPAKPIKWSPDQRELARKIEKRLRNPTGMDKEIAKRHGWEKASNRAMNDERNRHHETRQELESTWRSPAPRLSKPTEPPKEGLGARIAKTVKRIFKEESKQLKEAKKIKDDDRHGGPWDRGAADAHYGRRRSPHYYEGDTYTSRLIPNNKLTPEERAAYHRGYDSDPYTAKPRKSKQLKEGRMKDIDLALKNREPVKEIAKRHGVPPSVIEKLKMERLAATKRRLADRAAAANLGPGGNAAVGRKKLSVKRKS